MVLIEKAGFERVMGLSKGRAMIWPATGGVVLSAIHAQSGLVWSGNTNGRMLRLWGNGGHNKLRSCHYRSSAERLYPVDPVGVLTINPSAQ